MTDSAYSFYYVSTCLTGLPAVMQAARSIVNYLFVFPGLSGSFTLGFFEGSFMGCCGPLSGSFSGSVSGLSLIFGSLIGIIKGF